MSTTIRTSSLNYFMKIQSYLSNKKVLFTDSLDNGEYVLTIFNLSASRTDELILRMTRHFHLASKAQQEPLALAA